jgi:hypothetical protein
MVCIVVYLNFTMAPRVKDPAWIQTDLVDEEMYCKYCKKHIKWGRVRWDGGKLKQHLGGIRGQVAPYMAPIE